MVLLYYIIYHIIYISYRIVYYTILYYIYIISFIIMSYIIPYHISYHVYCTILYYIILLWDLRRVCGPSLTDMSLCGLTSTIYQSDCTASQPVRPNMNTYRHEYFKTSPCLLQATGLAGSSLLCQYRGPGYQVDWWLFWVRFSVGVAICLVCITFTPGVRPVNAGGNYLPRRLLLALM